MSQPSFTVICPVFNRAHSIAQALDSLIAQTDADWRCLVLDDGSTDDTLEIVQSYRALDERFSYYHYDENRGGVAMNEIGMAYAVERGGYWTRLGSDDWFLPNKLRLDRLALDRYGACYGPYRNEPMVHTGELNVPGAPRQALLAGHFAASWANIAMRTEVLADVKRHFGAFCDPRLRNMEDWIFNMRAARFAEFVWRAQTTEGGDAIIGATGAAQVAELFAADDDPLGYRFDARYRVALDGASHMPLHGDYVKNDYAVTEKLIGEDRARNVAVAELPPIRLEVVPL